VCALRMRALSHNRQCPVCKEECEEVLLTANAKKELPPPRRLEQLRKDEGLGVYFEDADIQQEAAKLFQYRCTLGGCAHSGRAAAFETLKELESHMWYKHWRSFCKVCLNGRPAFIGEQVTFDYRDVDRHCRHGGGKGEPHVPAHPECQFCQERFMDEEELLRHMNVVHQMCGICDRVGVHGHYFADVQCLAAHYAEAHYVCAHPNCTSGGCRLRAFSTEEDLALHMFEEHNQGRHLHRPALAVGVQSYAESRRGTAARNSAPAVEEPAASSTAAPSLHFKWPRSIQRRDVMKQLASEAAGRQAEASERLYPRREILREKKIRSRPQQQQQPEETERDDIVEMDSSSASQPADEKDVLMLPLEVSVATSGNQKGLRCCLDALQAVLQQMNSETSTSSNGVSKLRKAVAKRTAAELESFEGLRSDLLHEQDGCDWEPLERVLALRPLFFRLLRSGGASTTQRAAIGPSTRLGQDAVQASWRSWLEAAEAAVGALGATERSRLQTYIELCMERRQWLSDSGGRRAPDAPVPSDSDSESAHSVKEDFPALGATAAAATATAAPQPVSRWVSLAAQRTGNNQARPATGGVHCSNLTRPRQTARPTGPSGRSGMVRVNPVTREINRNIARQSAGTATAPPAPLETGWNTPVPTSNRWGRRAGVKEVTAEEELVAESWEDLA